MTRKQKVTVEPVATEEQAQEQQQAQQQAPRRRGRPKKDTWTITQDDIDSIRNSLERIEEKLDQKRTRLAIPEISQQATIVILAAIMCIGIIGICCINHDSEKQRQDQQEDSIESWAMANIPAGRNEDINPVSDAFALVSGRLKEGRLLGYLDSFADLQAELQPSCKWEEWSPFVEKLKEKLRAEQGGQDEKVYLASNFDRIAMVLGGVKHVKAIQELESALVAENASWAAEASGTEAIPAEREQPTESGSEQNEREEAPEPEEDAATEEPSSEDAETIQRTTPSGYQYNQQRYYYNGGPW